MKILLVEDDESIAQLLLQVLAGNHYLVDLAIDGQEGLEFAESFEYDLILLDLVLPKLDGINFCRQRRQTGDRTPILLMTAIDSSSKKVKGLDAGADDYVVKPLDLPELLARIRALLRRGNDALPPVIEWSGLTLNPNNFEVYYNDQLLHLTAKEYGLLELFLRNPNRIFSQSILLDHLWSFDNPPSENAVRTQIKSLRQKLKKAGAAPDLIETIYGLGYRLKSRDLDLEKEKDKEKDKDKKLEDNAPSPQQISSILATIWERHKQQYLKRFNVLEQVVKAWQTDNITETLQQQALREAHTLAGSLGSFGLKKASEKSREIEKILQAKGKISPVIVENLAELVLSLEQELKTSNTNSQEEKKKLEKSQSSVQKRPIITPNIFLSASPKLLIVDDDVALAEALVVEANIWGISSEIACNLAQAREAIASNQPDVILLDLGFPSSTEDGFKLLEELRNTVSSLPVIVFTAQDDFVNRVKVARLGGKGFLQKPISPSDVMNAIAQVLQKSSQTVAKLLIVDDDPQILDFLRIVLEPWGFQLTLLDDSKLFWTTLEQFAPDLVILDVEMPDFKGIELCQVVRNDPHWHELPILFISTHTDVETIQQVFSVGADDYISKPILEPVLVARILNRLERERYRRKMAD